MAELVYLDGKFHAPGRAKVSVFDAAMQHGVGLFETMQAFGGKVFQLDRHIDRLVTSAAETGLTDRLEPEALTELVELTVRRNDRTEARVRLCVTGGNLSMLPRGGRKRRGGHQPSVICTATDPAVYPPGFFTEGISLVVADPKLNPFDPLAGHKTLNYWLRLKVLAEAAGKQAGEALWLTVTNHLAGGSVSNVFVVRGGQLLTPIARSEEAEQAIPAPVLPGTTRAAVIDLAEELNLPVVRRMLTINDALEADELFLTNSSWQILPAVKLEQHTIGQGKVGPITQQLRAKLLARIERETSGGQGGEDKT